MEPSRRPARAGTSWRGVALLLIVAALYLAFINRTLECDEANTLYKYAQSLPYALLSYTSPNNHILHSVLAWLTMSLGGVSLVTLRLTAFAGALLGVAAAFRIGRRAGGTRAGLAAGALLAANLGYAGYAVNARGYTLSVFLTLLFVELVFLEPGPATRRRRYALLGLCAALLLLLPSMAILVAAGLLWLLWRAVRLRDRAARDCLAPLVTGALVGIVVYVPPFLAGVIGSYGSLFGEADLWTLARTWVALVFGTPLLGPLLAALAVIGLILAVRRGPTRLAGAGLVIIGITLVAALAQYALTGRVFFARNYFYLLGVLAVFGGVALAQIARRATVPVTVGILAVFALTLPALGQPGVPDAVRAFVGTNLPEDSALLTDSCLGLVAVYYLSPTHDYADAAWTPQSTARQIVVLVSKASTLDRVLAESGAPVSVDDCAFLGDVVDDRFEYYMCDAGG